MPTHKIPKILQIKKYKIPLNKKKTKEIKTSKTQRKTQNSKNPSKKKQSYSLVAF